MAAGIEIRRSDGRVLIGPNTRLSKILGMGFTNGAAAGRFDVPEWAGNPGWFAIMSPYNYLDGFTIPDVYQNPTWINWQRFAGGSAPTAPIWIMWGIY